MIVNLESIVMAVVGLGTLSWAVTSAYRSVKKVGGCSSCASSGDCPAVNTEGTLVDLTELTPKALQSTPCKAPPTA
ncbi:MAG: hypothetical protein ACI9UQ_001270 [Candidatus Krumholzibacteriia bacterium]|jgi:hypothetical protein